MAPCVQPLTRASAGDGLYSVRSTVASIALTRSRRSGLHRFPAELRRRGVLRVLGAAARVNDTG